MDSGRGNFHSYYNENPILHAGNKGTRATDCIAIPSRKDFSEEAFLEWSQANGLAGDDLPS